LQKEIIVKDKVEKYWLLFFLFSITLTSCEKPYFQYSIDIQYIQIDSLSQILPIIDTTVVPVIYDTLIISNLVSISEKKEQFINQILPAVLIVKYNEQQKYNRVEELLVKMDQKIPISQRDSTFLDSLKFKYESIDYHSLLKKLKPHQTSLVLAQAAIESGWGQSRFAIEGNNLFGVMASREDILLKNSIGGGGKSNRFSAKKYETVTESIEHYFFILGKHKAYNKFRIKRFEEKSVYHMIDGLNKYSEKGTEYTDMLKYIIKWNDLEKYDSYIIDESYIIDNFNFKTRFNKFLQNK
jgi:Bax protein